MKIEILGQLALKAETRIILTELVEYISYWPGDEKFISACIRQIVAIGRIPDFSEFVLEIILSFISRPPGLSSGMNDVVTVEAISALRELVVSAETPSIVTAISTLCQTCHLLPSGAKIYALSLISLCHDKIPLYAVNVLRSVGAEKNDSLVILHLAILAIQILRYHEGNHLGTVVPQRVSMALLGPLRELVTYIVSVGSKDSLVGIAVSNLIKGDLVDELVSMLPSRRIVMTDNRPLVNRNMHACVFWQSGLCYERPDTDVSENVPKEEEEVAISTELCSKSLSSDQASVNRMSADVVIPSGVTKPITSLEDLDLFFSKSMEIPIGSTSVVGEESSKIRPPEIKRATIDINDLC